MNVARWWQIYWAVWFIGGFAIVDTLLDYLGYSKYTLSNLWWNAEGINSGRLQNWTYLRFGTLVFLIWAILHLVYKKVG
jgi:hypothetical protein